MCVKRCIVGYCKYYMKPEKSSRSARSTIRPVLKHDDYMGPLYLKENKVPKTCWFAASLARS